MIRKYIIVAEDSIKGFDEEIAKLEREWGAEEIEPCEDAIRREDAIRIASINSMPVNECVRLIKELPSVKPQPKIDEIIKRIEETRDKDKLCEYPYNRCIDIVREVLGDD